MYQKKMHTHEIQITTQLVKQLIKEQFPHWKNLPIQPIKSSGTDNTIYRLGNDMSIRLPRIPESTHSIKTEQQWIAHLATILPLAIPVLIKQGQPNKNYPFHWSIYNWLDGENAFVDHSLNLHQAAIDLADCLRILQKLDTSGGPLSRRGKPLTTQDKETRTAINSLKNDIDTQTILSLWEQCLKAPEWDKQPVWTHGDLLPTNLLVNNHRLSAIIDFDMLGIGDPACDLLPAWSLFNSETREVFRTELAIDDATWMRGKGWALSIALIILPYYKDTNPTLVTIAQRIIQELIKDYQL